MSNIFEIIPNLYISTVIPSSIDGNIISINNNLESINENKILNINIDPNQLLILSNQDTDLNLNFDLINSFIIKSYQEEKNIIIISDNLIVGVLICINFISKYLKLDILEAIYYICKKINLNHKMLPSGLIYKLFINKRTK